MATWSWSAEKRSMERSFTLIAGGQTRIIDIVPPEDELGYTSKDKTIHLAYDHPTMKDLDDKEKAVFRKGVFCHELLHQVFTDFNASEKAIKAVKRNERRIFGEILNILEDPSIEYWAPTVVSGSLLKSLRFTIAHIYKNSPNIEEHKTAMGQYISALIQFGDMGLLKGRFTFPEAKMVFSNTAEVFEKGVTEPKAAKRVEYAKQIFEISRPLWQEEADMEQAMQELADMMSQHGKSATSGSGRGMDCDPNSAPSSKKDKRRKVTIKKVSKEEMEELKKNMDSTSGPIPEDADVIIYTCEEDEPKEEKSGDPSFTSTGDQNDEEHNGTEQNPSSENIEEEKESNSGTADAAHGEDDLPEDGEAQDSSEADGSNNAESEKEDQSQPQASNSRYQDTKRDSGSTATVPSSDSEAIEEDDISIDDDEYCLSNEDVDAILSDLERCEKEVTDESQSATDNSPIPDYDISSTKMAQRGCFNYRVSFDESLRDSLEMAYAETLSKMAVGIKTTTKALKRIFEDDKEEREYRSSGRISLKRLYSGDITDRIFEKKVAPQNKSDLVVELLVDESGSMSRQGKYLAARECCIALAEIFNCLNVPVYVIGFTADCRGLGNKVVHSHYITWKNTKDDRLKLLNISARANNCDGASIRYATEVIKNKKAKNKLLIVLSDGMPAASNYPCGREDTKDAIKTAKKHTSVLGVAIGNNDTELIQSMYEKDFMHVSSPDDLFANIAKSLKKIIRTW